MRLFTRRTGGGAPRRPRRQRRVAQAAALALLSGTLVVLAIVYDGSPVRDVDLNDGSVWVSNSSRGQLGRLNSQVKELDLSLVTSASSNEIFQQGSSVQVFDDGGGSPSRAITMVDAVSGTTLPVPLSGAYEAGSGGGTVAVMDDDTGRTWLRRTQTFEGLDASEPADLQVSERSRVAVTTSGTALIADREAGTVTPWRFDETGTAVAGEPVDFETTFLDDAALAAVGEVPVVLQGGKLYRPGADAVTVDGDDPTVPDDVRLQQVGAESPYVYLATRTGLWRGEVAGGELTRVGELTVEGNPAAPVLVAGCVHAAWNQSGTDNYLRSCHGVVTVGEVAPLTADSQLVFRTNRDVVVLNDTVSGTAWLVQEPGLTRVDNWDSVDPNAEDPQQAEADDEAVSTNRNKPPTAVDDEFGARAGATVILPITLNDIDPDGDVLVLTEPPSSQGDTHFSVVGDGTQVQAKVGANVSGEVTFSYSISDGQPGNPPSEAEVTLKIAKQATDTAPALIKDQTNVLTVANGRKASVNVLPAWIDPEGDAVVLVGAESDAGRVGFRPDGTIDFADDGSGAGEELVRFTVRGGGATKEGALEVTVVEEDKAEPTTVADHFTGSVGSTILLDPLANDIDPLGGQLALSTLTNVSDKGARVVRDGARGTATFTAAQPGAYYLTYEATASNGVPSLPQTIRVDVAPSTGTNRAPVATRDVAAVRAGSSVLVDVLANDTDPDGDVLVVQGVQVPPAYAGLVKASLINKRFVRVELTGTTEPGVEPSVDYLLSDGRSDQVTGAVAVTVADAGENRPPDVVEDLVTARAGTVVDIPVLENDKDPDGDRMTVEQQDLYDIGETSLVKDEQVPIVATGSTIRVLVPDDGTTQLQFGYGVRDSDQARSDSRVVININPDDPELNQKPQPRPIEDRTVTGQQIRVQVDSFGSDPDGDPVVFVGVLEPPKLGRISASGSDWFDYTPLDDQRRTGTDTFKVQVSDQYGLTGVADVRIGVAAPATQNQAPSALNDELLVKPELTVQYPVLRNDSDPDGDPLILDEDDLVTQEGTEARLVDGFIEVETPRLGSGRRAEAVQAIQYLVSDGLGATSSATYTVTVRADAPDYAPTTQDDVVTVDQLRDKVAGDTVDVDVLANDGDLDGSRENLGLEPVDPAEASVVDRRLRVTLRPESQLVPYRVTDQTDQTSFGFVYVNGTDSMPPMLDTTAVPLETVAGQPLSIDLADVVVVRPGRTAQIGNATLITESNGDTTPKTKSKLVFRTSEDFFGSASVTLPVIDGEDLQDPTGLEAQITIPITVLPATNVPPEVRDAAVTLAAGGEPVTIQLDRLATDANPDDELAFQVSGSGGGVTAEVAEDLLTIAAAGDAPSGQVPLTVAVSDGTAKPVDGVVTVTVIGRPADAADDEEPVQPAMTLRDLAEPDASAGTPIPIDVRDAILFDPYPDETKEIESLSATGPLGDPSVAGTVITVTPDSDGEGVVTYRLSDGSDDPARSVEGRITVTVAAPPDAPGAPHAVEGGPDSIQLTWEAPDDNGSEITEYVLTWDGDSTSCPATQCLVTDLDPGSAYRFTVHAVNAEGPGEESPPSDPVTPDTVPDQMAAPTISDDYTARDGQLQLSWTPPVNDGSEILHYEILSSPRVQLPDPGPNETSATIANLNNGTGYRFQILAVNDRGDGIASTPSEEETPFRLPDQMSPPTLTALNDNSDQKGYVTVTWPGVFTPQNGFDEITEYSVRLLRDGSQLTEVTVGGDVTEKSFDVENGHSYSAQVKATNRAGTSEYSGVSNAEISWDRAQAVSGIAKADDCPDNGCAQSTTAYAGRVSFTTPADNGGYPVTSYRWSTEDGQSGTVNNLPQGEGVGAAFNVTFKTNEAGQQVSLTPITTVPGQGSVDGTEASGGTFNPYAKPTPPTVACREAGDRRVRLCWTPGDGNGRPVSKTVYEGDARGENNGGGTGSVTIDTGQGGEPRCVRVKSFNSEGLESELSQEICATSNARTVTVSLSPVGAPAGPCRASCNAISVTVTGFREGEVLKYTTNITASDGSDNPSGDLPSIRNNSATKVVAYYNRDIYVGENYCVYITGYPDSGCKRDRT